MQDSVQNFAGTVAGEHASRTVRTMSPRCQSQNQHPRGRVAERRHGLAPICLAAVGAALQLRDFCRMLTQTGTTCAGYYLVVKNFQQKGPKW
jgi:hypothetical protein